MKIMMKIFLVGLAATAFQVEARKLSVYNDDQHGEYAHTIKYAEASYDMIEGGISYNFDQSTSGKLLVNAGQKDELSLWSDTFFNGYLIQKIDVLTSDENK